MLRNRFRRAPDAVPYIAHVDSPRWQDPPTHSVLVSGWVAVPRASAWEGPFVDVGELRPLELVQRGDVEAAFGDEWHVTGYQTIVPITGPPRARASATA